MSWRIKLVLASLPFALIVSCASSEGASQRDDRTSAFLGRPARVQRAIATQANCRQGEITFVSRHALSVMRGDGTARRALHRGRAAKFGTSWSPDGLRIAFSRTDRWGVRIYTFDRLRKTVRLLGWGVEPAWAPDGRRLAFSAANGGIDAVFLMEADGTARRPLTRPRHTWDHQPAWSPDSQWVAFVRGDPEGGSVYVVRARGGSLFRLTRARNDGSPAWSPDGSQLAFVRRQRIWVMNRDGSRQRQVSRAPRAWRGRSWWDSSPAWSPDGKQIAFSSFLEEPGARPRRSEIYSMWADGSARRRLTHSVADQYTPSWRSAC